MGPLLSGLSAFGFLAGLTEDVTTDQSFEVQGWFGKLDLTLRLDQVSAHTLNPSADDSHTPLLETALHRPARNLARSALTSPFSILLASSSPWHVPWNGGAGGFEPFMSSPLAAS